MGDVIFAEGNTTPHEDLDPQKAEILENILGPLQDVVENASGDHANSDLYDRAVARATILAYQWQEAVAGDAEVPAIDVPEKHEDRIDRLFTVASCIFDDASQNKETEFDVKRAAELVATLDVM